MIDSIHIRLHCLDKYKNIHAFLRLKAKRQFSEMDMNYYDTENKDPDFVYQRARFAEYFQEKGSFLFMDGQIMTSSHYHLGYSFPRGVECVDFNFSIPKLVYGSNLFQFVQHHTEHGEVFDYQACSKMDYNAGRTFKRLYKFVELFFQKEFGTHSQKVDMNDVEIRRFDICWNQLFNSKQDALDYLDAQKNQRKRHTRYTLQNKHDWTTSVYFSTADYGAKIYHKGNDYKKHGEGSKAGEKKHHKKINRGAGKMVFDVERIQAEADKILRFEITFRNSYMSKIFKRKVFRRHSDRWKLKMIEWNNTEAIHRRAFGKKKKQQDFPFSMEEWTKMSELDQTPYLKRLQSSFVKTSKSVQTWNELPKSERDFHDWWGKEKQKRVSFRMDVSEEVTKMNTGIGKVTGKEIEYDICQIPNEVRFSRYFLHCCFKVFEDFRQQFIIKHTHTLSEVAKSVEDYNDRVTLLNSTPYAMMHGKKKNIRLGKIRTLSALLNLYTFDQLVQKGMISRATAYNYKRDLKLVGANITKSYKLKIAADETGFQWYHQMCMNSGLAPMLNNKYFF